MAQAAEHPGEFDGRQSDVLKSLWTQLRAWDRAARQSFDGDLTTDAGRRAAFWHFNLFDHAFLRIFWTNFYPIGQDAFRSNQPGPARVQTYADKGIKTILSLRGPSTQAFHILEEDAAQKAGLTFHSIRLNARQTSPKEEFVALFEKFETMQSPWVLHCKSGADRAGLASALYVLWRGGTVEEAREQLSWRYMHLNNKNTGICDYILEAYAKDAAQDPMDIKTWFETRYDPGALQAAFNASVGRT